MSCRVCVELEQFLNAAREADIPEMLVGLNERALRNRLQQREEKIERQQLLLSKHLKVCSEAESHPSTRNSRYID